MSGAPARTVVRGFRRKWGQARSLCQASYSPVPPRYPFGIAFDIDGVLLKGGRPIEGATEAIHKLYKGSSSVLQVPFILLTNGGGVPESVKALELSNLLNAKILPEQVFLGHTPFKGLVERFGSTNVLVTGKGEPATVMTQYGYQNVLSLDDYILHFEDIDPLAKYKPWLWDKRRNMTRHVQECKSYLKKFDAAFIVSDPVDWGRDIQVLCDVLRSGGSPGNVSRDQPPLFFAADDFEYQAAFPVERLGMGAFRMALETIYNRVGEGTLSFMSFGKPKVSVFQAAHVELQKIAATLWMSQVVELDTIYMIGDNPATDIQGAREAGKPWFSILTRTGCFKGRGNHALHPADLVVDSVHDAVHYILQQHEIGCKTFL